MRRFFWAVVLISVAVFAGCGHENKMVSGGTSLPKVRLTKIVVAGSGSSVDLMRHLALAFEERNREIKIEVPDSVGSAGGIKLLKEGKIDLAMVSRPLAGGEKPGVIYRPFARSAVVFATHPTVKIKSLTSEQIVAIYNGKITNWRTLGGPDAGIVVLTRDIKASSKALLAEKISGFAGIKEPKSAVHITSQQNMQEALKSVPYSIGWIDKGTYSEYGSAINLLALDGSLPDKALIGGGKYPLIREFAFVYDNKAKKAARDFMNFVFSPLGKQVIMEHGYRI